MKKFHQIAIVLLFVAGFVTAAAQGQQQQNHNPISLVSARKMNAVDLKTCEKEGMIVRHYLSIYPVPNNWKFYVICDENSWSKQVRQGIMNGNLPAGVDIYGETSLTQGYTILRGYKLLYPDYGAEPGHVIAHELSHIYLDSMDEVKVEQNAQAWMAQQAKNPGSLVAATDAATVASTPVSSK